jgi:MerR family transcriptional regulator, light-induced transcriptional regulator
MNVYTIKDLENLSGVKAHTLRMWEQRYDFLKPQRTTTNIRYYTAEQLKNLLNIALLNKYGFKISHINRMTATDLQQKVLSLSNAEARYEKQIIELIQQMIDMDINGFEKSINQLLSTGGIEKTFTQVIFPFLKKTGVLWTTDSINPAQEHLVTNLIRQKLIAGLENIKTGIQINKPVLLFLPENEYHEISLLFVNYLLKSRGVITLYLGTHVPLNDIEKTLAVKKPAYLYTHLTAIVKNFNVDIYLQTLGRISQGIPCIISGRLTQQVNKKMPENIKLKHSLNDVMQFINEL